MRVRLHPLKIVAFVWCVGCAALMAFWSLQTYRLKRDAALLAAKYYENGRLFHEVLDASLNGDTDRVRALTPRFDSSLDDYNKTARAFKTRWGFRE